MSAMTIVLSGEPFCAVSCPVLSSSRRAQNFPFHCCRERTGRCRWPADAADKKIDDEMIMMIMMSITMRRMIGLYGI